MKKLLCTQLLALACCLTTQSHAADVVINEIMYRAPMDLSELEYVELWNSSNKTIDIGGWKIQGVGLELASGTSIAPGAFHVTCRNAELYERIYQQKPDSVYPKSLSDRGERLKLVNTEGQVVESVKYNDKSPWPTSADGRSASLERITPTHEADDPHNWAPSALTSEFESSPSGTPGKPNTAHQESLPPVIQFSETVPSVIEPETDIQLSTTIQGRVSKVEILMSVIEPGEAAVESVQEMSQANDGTYQGRIPGQSGGKIVRYRFKATGVDGATGWLPHPNELRPTFSSYVKGELPETSIPMMHFISTSDAIASNFETYKNQGGRRFGPGGFGFGPPPRESREDIQKRELARRINGDALRNAFTKVTLGHPLSTDKLLSLTEAVRSTHEALGTLRGDIARSRDVDALQLEVQQKLEQLSTDLLKNGRPILPEEDNAALSKSVLENDDNDGDRERFDPTRLVRAFFDIERRWYQHLIIETPTPSLVEKLLPVFASAMKQRDSMLAKFAQPDKEPDLPTVFGEARSASEALDEQTRSILGNASPEPSRPIRNETARNEQREEPRGGRERFRGGPGRGFGPGFGSSNNGSPVLPQGEAALVYREPGSDKIQFFDYINILPRKSGNKVRFQKDQPLNDMTTLNVLYEPGHATTINEMLAYPLYEQAGNVTVNSGAVRVLMNGAPVGYHLWFEQPNGSFFKRRGIDSDGNLYKVIWQESNRPSEFTPESERTDRNDIESRWEKVTHPHESHADLVEMIEDFEEAQGKDDEMWQAIERHFDVDQAINYYAVNLLISHWDGFFNNYFLYHDVKGTGKWSILPWDQDSTWSLRGGSPESLSKMPLNYGGEGARPPGSSDNGRDRGRFGGRGGFGGFGGFGGGGFGWWRDGDIISKSLIGNPTFFAKYKQRLRELVQKTFTQENLHPIFERLESVLLQEVALRARLSESDAESEKQRFSNLFNTLLEHLELRRTFLLGELDLAAE